MLQHEKFLCTHEKLIYQFNRKVFAHCDIVVEISPVTQTLIKTVSISNVGKHFEKLVILWEILKIVSL